MTDRRKIKKMIQVGGRRETDSIAMAQKQDDRITNLEDQHKELLEKLTPMIDAFNAASKLGKWGTSLLVFLSVAIGIVLGIIKIFHHK